MQENVVANILNILTKPSINVQQTEKSLNSKKSDDFENILRGIKNTDLNPKRIVDKIENNEEKIAEIIVNFLNLNNINEINNDTLVKMVDLLSQTGFADDKNINFEAVKNLLVKDKEDIQIFNNDNSLANNKLDDSEILSLFQNFLKENYNTINDSKDVQSEIKIKNTDINNNNNLINNPKSNIVFNQSLDKSDNGKTDLNTLTNGAKLNLSVSDSKDTNNFKESLKEFSNKINGNNDTNKIRIAKVENGNTDNNSDLNKSLKFQNIGLKLQKNVSKKVTEINLNDFDVKTDIQNKISDNKPLNNVKILEVKKDSDIMKIADFIEVSKVGNKTKLTVQLSPAELGKINIQLHDVNGKLSAKIFVEADHTKNLLVHHSDAIKNQLSEKGIVIDNMDFEFMGDNSGNNSFANRNNTQNSKEFNLEDKDTPVFENVDIKHSEGRIYA